MHRILWIPLLLVLGGCVTQPAQVVIGPSSRNGLLLVEIDPDSATLETGAGRRRVVSMGYFLTFSRYPGGTSSEPAALGDWVHVDFLDPKDKATRFYAVEAPPGSYAFEALNVGYAVSWGACFNRATVAFDVRAGEVVYVGKFSPHSVFEDLYANLPDKLPGGTYRYLFDREAPALASPASVEEKVAEVSEYLGRVYPGVHAPITMGQLRKVSFRAGTPSGLTRFPRCARTS